MEQDRRDRTKMNKPNTSIVHDYDRSYLRAHFDFFLDYLVIFACCRVLSLDVIITVLTIVFVEYVITVCDCTIWRWCNMCVLNTQSMIIFIFTRLMNIRKEAKLHLQGEIEQNRGDRAKVNKSNIYVLCTIKIDRILEFIDFFLVYLIIIACYHTQKT